MRTTLSIFCVLVCGTMVPLLAAPSDPHSPGFVEAKELPDSEVPSADANGNFILGPTHPAAPEMVTNFAAPRGMVIEFTMNSADSKIFPGIVREPQNVFGTPDPVNPAKLIVTNSHPAPYVRKVVVYVPAQYVPGTVAPFLIGADGPDRILFAALDNLIAEKKIPALVAISIGNGGGDAQGSERGLEYDTMSGRYAEFVEQEVLPLVESKCHVKLTPNPDGRAAMGTSSGGACALSMAWYHPEWYRRVLSYSGTFVNQQWPPNPATPHGAWEYHEHLIPENPAKPLRLWLEVGDADLLNPNAMRDGMHDWVLANERMARVLAAKGYAYQFVFARNARHGDRAVKQQTLPEALEWLWRGYPQVGATDVPELKLAAIFTDNMVLQQNLAVPIWGWSKPGAAVTVKFSGQTKTTRTAANGQWLVTLDKLTATAEPQTLAIESGQTIVFKNILIGEVWLCSGQSNMVKPIGNTTPDQKPCFNDERELANADYPNIRFFRVWEQASAERCSDFKVNTTSGWLVCSSNSLGSQQFSAAAYFFGREIHTNLHVPVGLIESAWGGTRIEPWTPPEGFESVAALTNLALPAIGTNRFQLTTPSNIYNEMIAPMAGFAIRGALWYQGEANCQDADIESYLAKMMALVGGWRKVWNEGDFPFYFVQLAPFRYGFPNIKPPQRPSEILPVFWEIQSQAAQRIKNTGMVVTTDLVDDLSDIHPRNKQDVGYRLALLALNKTYGKTNVVCSGPRFRRMEIVDDRAVLAFDGADGGLVSKDGQPLTWFTIASAGGEFVPATAKIVGNKVEVFASTIKSPIAVRFAWDQTAQPNFSNGAGLPAEPFRTDNSLR